MFKELLGTLKTYSYSEISSDFMSGVVAEYGKLTGINLEEKANRFSDKVLLESFCSRAKEKGLSEIECATLIFAHGFRKTSVIN
jgi:hypothetical protein